MNLKKWILTVMFVKGLLSLKFIQYRSLEELLNFTSRQILFLQMSTNFNKVCWLLETFNFFIRPHSPFKHTELLKRKFMIYHWLSYFEWKYILNEIETLRTKICVKAQWNVSYEHMSDTEDDITTAHKYRRIEMVYPLETNNVTTWIPFERKIKKKIK